MKHILLSKKIIFGVLTLSLLTSCAGLSSSDDYTDIEMLPAKVKGDENFSLYKPDGKIIYRDQLPQRPSAVIDGVFSMATSDGSAIYSAADADAPRLIKSGFAAVGQPADGVIPVVRPDSRIELVNLNGETVSALLPYEGHEVTQSMNRFSEQRLAVETDDGNWGYVDTKGEWVVKPGYFFGCPFSEGKAIVINEKADGNGYAYSVIDLNGNELYAMPEGIFAIDLCFVDGYAFCKGDNNGPVYKLTDDFKMTQMPSDICVVSQRYNDLAVYCEDDLEKKGVFDGSGNIVIAPEYPAVTIINQKRFLVINQDKTEWQVIDKEADVVKAFPSATYIENLGRFGLGVVDGNGEVTMVDSKNFKPVDAETIFSDFDNGKPQTLRLNSQYFDWEAFANDIVGIIDDTGIGKYKIGYLAENMLSNPARVENDPIVSLDELKIVRNKYSADVFGTFVADNASFFVALFTGELDYKLKVLTIDFDTTQPTTIETATALKNALQKANFSQTDVTNDDASQYAAIYKSNSGSLGVFVEFVPGEKTGTLSIYSAQYRPEYTNNLRQAISKYNAN